MASCTSGLGGENSVQTDAITKAQVLQCIQIGAIARELNIFHHEINRFTGDLQGTFQIILIGATLCRPQLSCQKGRRAE